MLSLVSFVRLSYPILSYHLSLLHSVILSHITELWGITCFLGIVHPLPPQKKINKRKSLSVSAFYLDDDGQLISSVYL